VTAVELTIAWTAAEAVLIGPDSRLIRQPLAADDDHPAVILEAWRTEFPEVLGARLLGGYDAALASAVARLGELAAEAGLAIHLAAAAPARRPLWPRWRLPRRITRTTIAGIALALIWGGWRWHLARETGRLSLLTAEERRAETDAAGQRQAASDEQARAVVAACAVPRQYQGELLRRLAAAIPPAVVLETLELNGDDCLLRGQIVAGAPGGEGCADTLRRALFEPAARWRVEPGVSAGSDLTLQAVALADPREAPPSSRTAARTLREHLITAASLATRLTDWAPLWSVTPTGSSSSAGIECRHFQLVARHHDMSAWTETLQLVEDLNRQAGVSVDRLSLRGGTGHNGALDQVSATISVRLASPSTDG